MQIDKNNPSHIIAAAGYEFMRKVSGERMGSELWLGYSHYIGGVLQDPPHKDVIEDFEEIKIEEDPESE